MVRNILLSSIIAIVLVACGGGGGGGSGGDGINKPINSVDYKLPTSVPSVPDQAGK